MTRNEVLYPVSGNSRHLHVPEKVHRRTLARPVYKRKLCSDDRNYAFIPFTIAGDLEVADYGPEWRVDHHYWIARITLQIGLHKSGDHPDDGTPSGDSVKGNMRRITADGTGDAAILNSDSRLVVNIDNHQDAINADEDGEAVEGDFNILKLEEGERIYPSIIQIGSGRPGTKAVMTAVLVPIP